MSAKVTEETVWKALLKLVFILLRSEERRRASEEESLEAAERLLKQTVARLLRKYCSHETQ